MRSKPDDTAGRAFDGEEIEGVGRCRLQGARCTSQFCRHRPRHWHWLRLAALALNTVTVGWTGIVQSVLSVPGARSAKEPGRRRRSAHRQFLPWAPR